MTPLTESRSSKIFKPNSVDQRGVQSLNAGLWLKLALDDFIQLEKAWHRILALQKAAVDGLYNI